MAQRRMFCKDIVCSDAFLEMPTSSQLLYFQLGMEADDDGFVASPKRITRMVGVNEDDLKILLGKRFVLPFPSGIIVIKHWKINNYIQADRYHETKYLEEKKALITKENGAYTECIQVASRMDTQSRLGKARQEQEPRVFFKKNGEEIPLSTGDTYQADGWSPLEVMAMKKRAARALGIKKSSRWSQLSFGSAWDFKKAFKFYMGYEYAGTVYLDEMAKTLADWYEAGETRETIREMIIAFFASEKAQKITITPNSVFSPHTYNSWKQGKLKAEPKKRNFWE